MIHSTPPDSLAVFKGPIPKRMEGEREGWEERGERKRKEREGQERRKGVGK